MRAVIFAYHNMGILGLEALQDHGVELSLVVTHPDNEEEIIWYGSVAEWCERKNVECIRPDSVNDSSVVGRVRGLSPDFIFSFYCRQLLCSELLGIPEQGALNLHGSMLPRYRGCAPVNWVLVNGEEETGVTLHYMVERADAGDIIGQEPVAIAPDDTALTLYAKIEDAARVLLARVLPDLLAGEANRLPQKLSEGFYCRRRTPEDGKIDWRDSAVAVCNLIRAVSKPYPGAFCELAGKRIIIWRAIPFAKSALEPGEIKADNSGVTVGTGDGAVMLYCVECEGQLLEGDGLVQAVKSLGPYMSLRRA